MNDTVVTVHGRVVGDVATRTTHTGIPLATFQVACTPRRPGRSRGEWVDGPTSLYSVVCWRALAVNAAESLTTGAAVIVHGRLTHRPVSQQVGGDTVPSAAADIEAFSVGPDLNCAAVEIGVDESGPVRRAERRSLREAAMAMHPAGGARRQIPSAHAHSTGLDQPQVDQPGAA